MLVFTMAVSVHLGVNPLKSMMFRPKETISQVWRVWIHYLAVTLLLHRPQEMCSIEAFLLFPNSHLEEKHEMTKKKTCYTC